MHRFAIWCAAVLAVLLPAFCGRIPQIVHHAHEKKFFCPTTQQRQNGSVTISLPSRLASALHQK